MAPSETYYLLPNLQALDPAAREHDPSATSWVQPIDIDDDDLTFGGKSLSEWHEEDRRRFSSSSGSVGSCSSSSSSGGEDERRGRERVRRSYPEDKKSKK